MTRRCSRATLLSKRPDMKGLDMTRLSAAVLSASLAFTATAALADTQAADQCAAGLSADSKVIYDDVAPGVTADTDLRSLVTERTKALVMDGKIKMGDARSSAEAAGECLVKLKS